MNNLIFENKAHHDKFNELINQLPEKFKNCEGYYVAYLLALVGEHENDLFDFKEGLIKPEGLSKAWQCSSSIRATRLMFALWNGCQYNPEDAILYYIFGDAQWDKYFIEAIRIRFDISLS